MQSAPVSFNFQTLSELKIIVVDLGFLGDSVQLVPALWEIKRHYPAAQLHTLSATVGAELLALAPCVDRSWAFPLTPQSPPWWRHWDIIGALRREKFDAAFNFSGADRTIFLTALTGAKWRLAHEGGRRHFWNRWLIANWVPCQSREIPVFEQRRQVLAAVGFALGPARFDLRVPDKAREWAAANIPANSIHLSINASSPLKEWPLDNWADLAALILKSDPAAQLAATAAPNARESARLDRLAAAVPDARLKCLKGLSLGQLAALLQRCRMHLGADSGVLHLAAALGVPTFTVFRKYPSLKEWLPPDGLRHRYLATGCRCIETGWTHCQAVERAECLAAISATDVFEAIRPMWPISSKNLNL
jgi:ADP-heptose:LPS heptosyltransferase